MQIYNVYQSGKRLYIDEKENPDNKIVVNKYDNMQQTLRLISDGTLPPRLYWALRNPKLSNKYFILKLVNNEDLIVGTDISAYAGLWDMLLIGTDEDYIIEGADIDQSRLTYVSDHFGRLFVRDNFLEELDFEEQCSPTFKVFYDEIMFQLDNIPDLGDIPDKMSDLENDTNFISGVAFKDDGNGNVEIIGTTFSGGETEEGEIPSGGSVEVDDKLDEESTNPVQNQVIAKEVKSLKEKDESIDKEVIALRERNTDLEETIEKLQIKQTTDKAPFHHITDSANYRVLDFGMEGKTEQETVPGNQLFDITKVTDCSTSTFSVTNNGNGTLTICSTVLAANAYNGKETLKDYAPNLVVGETYTLNAISGGGQHIYLIAAKFTWTFGKSVEITQDMLDSVVAWYAVDSNGTPTTISNIMINPGTTALPWEPYTGGAPSPNPDYPQEIVNAGVYNEETGRYEHKCCVGNKNLFDFNTLKKGYIDNGVIKVIDGFWHSELICVSGKNSVCISGLSNLPFAFSRWDEDKVFINRNGLAIKDNVVIPCNGCSYIIVEFTNVKPSEVDKVQIEFDMKTSYTPHASQPFTLTSDRPLTKWDKLVKRDGVWGWSVNSVTKTFDGTESWIWYADFNCVYCQITDITRDNDSKCTAALRENIITNTGDVFDIGQGNYTDSVWIRNTDLSGLEEYKEWFSTNTVVIQSKSAIEVAFIPLPENEQTLLNNLETYYGVTNLYNEQGCLMWLCYTCDSKLYVDQKLEQINSALLSLGANV